ncbi:hypothetical protein [Nocardia sp. CA-120079]|uniref:hypothetical protein n=1 Tax=Nocardia sp. CA-120079 TaxID=3239974 RepID=UPI003D95ED84
MPPNEEPSNARPRHQLPVKVRTSGRIEIPVKVRIVGTPSGADLDQLTESVAGAVDKQLRASASSRTARTHDPRPVATSPIHDPKFAPPSAARMRKLLPDVIANEADEQQRTKGDWKLSPPRSTAEVGEHAEWLAQDRLRVEGPDTVVNTNPRHRWHGLAEVMRQVAAHLEADPATFSAMVDAVAKLYVLTPGGNGAIDARIDKKTLLASGLAADDIAELDRIFTSTGLAPEGIAVRDWYIRDDTGRGLHVRDKTRSEIEDIEQRFAAQRRAAIRAQAEELLWGLLFALGGARKGSASQGLVVPRAGAADGPARIYTPRAEIEEEAAPFAGLLPTPPGEVASNRGFQREYVVARLVYGTLARTWRIADNGALEDLKLRFHRGNGQSGAVDVDVIGEHGELILVGGPAKGGPGKQGRDRMANTIQRVADLKLAAAERGVGALAYFTRDTPKDVVDKAIKHLGPANVVLFDDPVYREPPR